MVRIFDSLRLQKKTIDRPRGRYKKRDIMIKKIISGGQTGADRAALDTAIKFNINYGGWIPQGRKTEEGPLSHKYHMDEMPTDSYSERTRQNIMDSQGTIIISRGPLTGGSLLTQKFAFTLKKPCCHVDLFDLDEFAAAIVINSFIVDYALDIINIAGPRAGKDPFIYNTVRTIIETVIYMMLIEAEPDDLKFNDFILMERRSTEHIKTLDAAVKFLADIMHLKTKSCIANSDGKNIASLYFSMSDYIKVKTGLDSDNKDLLNDCAEKSGFDSIEIEDAVMVILKALKAFLEKKYILRVIK